MKWSLAGLIVVGVIAAVSAALLVASLQSGGVNPSSKEVTIVKATKALPWMSRVTEDAITEVKVARGTEPAGAITSKDKIVGKPIATPMLEGQTFTTKSVVPDGGGATLAAMLEPGKRAVNVSLSDYAGLNGLLYPGAHVDVLASFSMNSSKSQGTAVSTTLLQDVMVLAIEDEVVGSQPEARTEVRSGPDLQMKSNRKWRITLMVDTKQDKALQLAQDHGQISLAMRNPSDKASTDTEATVLSEGVLAKLASALAPNVGESSLPPELRDPKKTEKTEKPVETPPAVAPPPAPVAEKPAPPKPTWDVTIIRGSESETRSFLYDDSNPGPTKVGKND